MALNAIQHGLSIPMGAAMDSMLAPPDHSPHVALQAITDLIEPECIDAQAAQRIALTILEFERNEVAQREFFLLNSSAFKTKPTAQALAADFRQSIPEYEMLGQSIQAQLARVRPDKRWIASAFKAMHRLPQAHAKSIQQEQARAMRRWSASQRYLKRAANQLSKALRANARGQS